jgi:hypothetical protein
MPARHLSPRPNLEQYRKQAKDLVRSWKAGDARTKRKLADAQFEIAREHGFETWKKFTEHIDRLTGAEDKAAIWKAAEGRSSRAKRRYSNACCAITRRCSAPSGRSRHGTAAWHPATRGAMPAPSSRANTTSRTGISSRSS